MKLRTGVHPPALIAYILRAVTAISFYAV